ncbi:MAG: hypothetical protein U0V54_05700 [Saprospiraceae bacterium]|nr:hypothetical protein [Saprospiraceae bacterium]
MEKITLRPSLTSKLVLVALALFSARNLYLLISDYYSEKGIVNLEAILDLSFFVIFLYVLYQYLRNPGLEIDENGITKLGPSPIQLKWQDVAAIKQHPWRRYEFVDFYMKPQAGEVQGKMHRFYVRHYPGGGMVLFNFLEKMPQLEKDERGEYLHNLDWIALKPASN